MTIELVSGGGIQVEEFISGKLSLASGASGDILTISPASNQIVQLTGLVCSAGGAESGITVTVGGREIITSLILDTNNESQVGEFSVRGLASASTGNDFTGTVQTINGAAGEDIVVSKDTGSTSSTISYSYNFIRA